MKNGGKNIILVSIYIYAKLYTNLKGLQDIIQNVYLDLFCITQ